MALGSLLWVHAAKISVFALMATLCMAQSHHNGHQMGSNLQVAIPKGIVQIDGSVNPEQIPDDIAYLHFFRSLAKNSSSTDTQLQERRRNAYLRYFFRKGCGQSASVDNSLREGEMVSLLMFVDRLMPTLNEAGSSLAGRTNTEQKMAQQKTKKLILEAIGALPNAVGPDAAEKIRWHVANDVKTHIKIVSTQIPQGAGQ